MPIQVEHLTHTYLPGSPFSATAIHDLSLTIEDGEFIGVLGHTGSGKTTFVQHLNGLLKPSEGRVIIDGVDITKKGVSLLDVRKKVGLVFQYPEYQLFEESVAKDVAFGPKNMGLTKPEIDERVRWAIAQVGLDYDAVADCSPFELSGGQMRRVAIAGVLAMKPKTLILDEPTAGLDPRGRRAILDMIRRLHAETAMTVIMVSHNMDDIAPLATRLIVMSKGELAMSGVPREVFRQRNILRAIGLGVPQGAELCYRLREAGYAIPDSLYMLAEVRDAILKLAGKAKIADGVCTAAVETIADADARMGDEPKAGADTVVGDESTVDVAPLGNAEEAIPGKHEQDEIATPDPDAPEGAATPVDGDDEAANGDSLKSDSPAAGSASASDSAKASARTLLEDIPTQATVPSENTAAPGKEANA